MSVIKETYELNASPEAVFDLINEVEKMKLKKHPTTVTFFRACGRSGQISIAILSILQAFRFPGMPECVNAGAPNVLPGYRYAALPWRALSRSSRFLPAR